MCHYTDTMTDPMILFSHPYMSEKNGNKVMAQKCCYEQNK